ncbi:glycosyltransferase [Psychroflexus sp. MES1-P1E]|uniref:glycosyltransferase n=1 Tax=Psychroflexus sp. MES1-P1E TaxID=2058320 RepID=UPI000C7D72C0|nr:glycosyltransferase [Psychroflexus sp. MES1-P1E]PKG43098.1 glycosyltransferase [Psychroflexus sp. MES1-P1E]
MAFPTHVLVAPLNWGLGHASRCIPIINYFLEQDANVSIASDGAALELLKGEFPNLNSLELNSSQVVYSSSGFFFYLKLILQGHGLKERAKKDEILVESYAEKNHVDLIISDHRFGAFSKPIKSVIISHQLQFKAGLFSRASSFMNAKYHNRYDEIWIPDAEVTFDLSGVLSHSKQIEVPTQRIGVLSRFSKIESPEDIDYLAVISGPEPLRTSLEKCLITAFQGLSGKKTVIVRGVYNIESLKDFPNISFYNHLKSKELNALICRSKLVVCRSGYSSVMDLACLGKKAFFIPTPHQGEQEYLAKRLEKLGIAPYSDQENFKVSDLQKVSQYSGFKADEHLRFPLQTFRRTLEG